MEKRFLMDPVADFDQIYTARYILILAFIAAIIGLLVFVIFVAKELV